MNTLTSFQRPKHVKKAEKSFETTELIVQDLANLFNIKCAKYESVNIDGVFYYLSEDLNEQGRLIPIDVFMPNKNQDNLCLGFIFTICYRIQQ